MALKAVLFDLGLTLIRTASFPEIYRQILARFGVTASLDDIARAQEATESEADTSTYDDNLREEFWTNYNASLLKKLGITDNVIFLATQIDKLWWKYSHVQVFSDVEPTLSQLKTKGLKLGLVSNGFKKDLAQILGELGLKKWFDVIVCIESCNCAKPDKEIFLYALNRLGVESHEAVFVGDSVKQDYEGAFNVGIRPFLLDREGKHPCHFNKIAGLCELLTML
ncbi:MAG: HAD-IA family hydrolase [Candidatus Bathyarchaeota archaeon]|nr:HAD-IA family hydrolase [Candidatus Bathyarchaeum sp.]